MKLLKAYTGYKEFLDIGAYTYFIILGSDGADIQPEELADQSKHFNSITIIGSDVDPFYDKKELSEYILKLVKYNPYCNIQVYTDGKIRPVGINKIDNASFVVFVPLKNTGIEYKERINEAALRWFKDADTKFIFRIESADDIDEATMLANTVNMKKAQICFLPDDKSFKVALRKAKLLEYNIAFETKEVFENE